MSLDSRPTTAGWRGNSRFSITDLDAKSLVPWKAIVFRALDRVLIDGALVHQIAIARFLFGPAETVYAQAGPYNQTHFIAGLIKGAPFAGTGRKYLHTLATVEAAYRSIARTALRFVS